MSLRRRIAATRDSFFVAMQFLTRIPVPEVPHSPESLSSAVKFFPIVGLMIGLLAALLHLVLAPHLPRILAALLVITFLVALTGALHEDGLADAADGFGGGWNRDQVLVIFKDSRIGTYGAAALSLALIARVLLLASVPLGKVSGFLIAAIVLSRWSVLPLSFYLPPARVGNASLGARIARMTTLPSLIFGSFGMVAIVVVMLRTQALAAIVAAMLATLLTGIYYRHRIGGVTGDCFGATIQLTEIVVLLTGVWTV